MSEVVTQNDKPLFTLRFKKPIEVSAHLRRELEAAAEKIGDNVEVLPTGGNGVAIRLHNKDVRPTVYHIVPKVDRYGDVASLVIDTIINEKKDVHKTLKKSTIHVNFLVNLTKELMAQGCDGSRKETLKNYQPMGLLYQKRDLGLNR
jgi:fructose-specific phosphotransferase system component IIB